MLKDDNNWTTNQLKFIYCQATSKAHRKPATQQELAGERGVTEVTLSRWKAKPELSAEANQVARAGLSKNLPEVYGSQEDGH
jgi:Helix-turn-helix of insertion element transposase